VSELKFLEHNGMLKISVGFSSNDVLTSIVFQPHHLYYSHHWDAPDGWTITHDPYPLQAGRLDLAIDLGAEKTIAAQRNSEKIAVEIKSFLGSSKISAFYGALEQFITYREALQIQEPDRQLFLAVPSDIYDKFILNR
jgi:XisH protein